MLQQQARPNGDARRSGGSALEIALHQDKLKHYQRLRRRERCDYLPVAMADHLDQLKARLAEINNLQSAAAVLHWDQSTYMPPGGAAARARQIATLHQIAHAKFTDPAVGALLEKLNDRVAELSYESDDAALVRVAQREYERATRIPADFVASFSAHQSALYAQWIEARPANNFAAVLPGLERSLELSRQQASFFPGHQHLADPLIDFADHGMTVATIRPLFAQLRTELVPLLQAITRQPAADDACLKQPFPLDKQEQFAVGVIRQFGYDFARGRQDRSPHPFMTSFSIGDARITTRYREDDLSEALFSTLHEAGHALYEQGVDPALEGTLLAGGTSSGVHESQSRLWENIVGRSRGFWEHFYPRLQQVFPTQIATVSLDTFYRAINRVERSVIRTDADEVTYNLHVMIRFELELALLEGSVTVHDLPEVWRQRYRADLGIASADDRDGVLQDVHWFSGTIGGAFQGYTLGNILSAQFYEAACRANPEIPTEITRGMSGTLHDWLRLNVYRHGSKFTAAELIERATGQPLTIRPYLRYLRDKFTVSKRKR